jgi:N-acetyl-anhydromuramyl-L-alanine amidase AmpD
MSPVAICYHTTWDMSLQNVINHFRNPASEASSTFVIDRDGTAFQMVSSTNAPWTNGDYRDRTGKSNNPTTLISWLTHAMAACDRGENNLNEFFITYEFISTPDIPPTDPQYETAILLSRYFCHPTVYGISRHRGHHIRHADINSVSRWYDPGRLFDLRRIILAIGGDPTNFNG